MDLMHIAVFIVAVLVYLIVLPIRWRGWALMIGSVIAIYWLQPPLVIRHLDFVLPTTTIIITILIWWIIKQPATQVSRDDWIAMGVAVGIILLLSFTRFLAPEIRLTSRPPSPLAVVFAVLIFAFAFWSLRRFLPISLSKWLVVAMLGMIAVFVVVKSEPLAAAVSRVLRTQSGQDVSLASAIDLQWLGFSYVAFRLLHTLRDRQTDKLPELSFHEYLTYVIFFPSFTAGPIDRAERFISDYRKLTESVAAYTPQIVEGGTRISIGLLKKFVIADTIALFSLNATNAEQALNGGSLWILLYAYAFRLYFDFSGYSDIAIGIGILFGIKLPENFDNPYMKNSIARFWQSWHITLSNWVRFYVFSPLSRNLLRRKSKPPTSVILFLSHLSTMMVIGLWHGVTGAFLIWGIWHGLGLFVHKMWSDRTRKWYISLKDRPTMKRAWTVVGVLFTFHFVVLGWVWFALPNVEIALTTFARLFGGQS